MTQLASKWTTRCCSFPGEWNHGATVIHLSGEDDRATFDAIRAKAEATKRAREATLIPLGTGKWTTTQKIIEEIHQEHASFSEFWNHNTANLED